MLASPLTPARRLTAGGLWRAPTAASEAGEAGRPVDLCSGLRTILVPPDIIPVQRRSPVRTRKRTPWRPQPEGAAAVRPGGREWFSDRLFVEPEAGHARAGYSASIAVHAISGVALTLVVLTAPVPAPVIRAGRALVMPAMVSMAPLPGVASAPSRAAVASAPKALPPPPPAAASTEPVADTSAAAPVEAPSTIAPESGLESAGESNANGVAGGIVGGIAGGTVGGTADGVATAGGAVVGPLRIGGDLRSPRKIKHVNPIYPSSAIASQAGGVVIIDAVIGPDGKVRDAKVLRSVPALDQAALEAVRQWEYMPTIINGEPVPVVLTVIVSFAIR